MEKEKTNIFNSSGLETDKDLNHSSEDVKMNPYRFKLPIEYLDTKYVHTLPDVVVSDLELVSASSTESMYDTLLKPQNIFAKNIIENWKKSFTSDVEFLKQTQKVIMNSESETEGQKEKKEIAMVSFPEEKKEGALGISEATISEATISEAVPPIMKDIYETPTFCDKYSYIDIEKFHFVNNSSNFLGFWTIINLISPIFSIMLPLILLIAPFVLLKIQRVPIEFSTYINVLKDIAKQHALGKMFNSVKDFSINNLVYILFTIAMYAIQMYQNVKSCIRFYNNIHSVNTNLITLQKFVDESIIKMESFTKKNAGLSRYYGFCHDVSLNIDKLLLLKEELRDIKPFCFGVSKCFEVGYLLKCYYSLYSNMDYKSALNYAVSFNGFIENMESLCLQVKQGILCFGTICEKEKATVFKGQRYFVHCENPILNTLDLKKNIIITGPNASGKTTQLKATAINIILTQQFGLGFYKSATLVPYTHIHSYLNIPDTSGRDSLFQAEARRCKEILDIIDNTEESRHFCIFDELFSGTNAEEATSASFGFLKYLQKNKNVDFILTTHFTKLCKKVKNDGNLKIENYKMDALLDGNKIVFHYKLVKGISKIKAAKLILLQMGFPIEVLK